MTQKGALRIIGDIASVQWGLITAAQARAHGIEGYTLQRLTARGVLHRVRHGVYAIVGTPDDDARRIRAEWLAVAGGEEPGAPWRADTVAAVVGWESAAVMHNIGAMPLRAVTLYVRRRRQSSRAGVKFRTAPLARAEICDIDGLPVTTALRTLSDLWNPRVVPRQFTNMFLDAEAQGLLTVEDLGAVLGIDPELLL